MKPDLSGPPRLADAGTDRLADLLRAERGRRPSDETARRLAKNIVPAKLAERAALGRGAKVRASAPAVAGGAAIVVASLALLSWRSHDTAALPAGSAGEPAAIATIKPATQPTSGEEAPAPAADMPATAADVPTLDVAVLPAPSAGVRTDTDGQRRATVTAKSSQGSPSAPPKRGPTELELLLRARSSLASDPARCLEIAGEHAAAYPNGQFVQEREVIIIEAIARLGRRDEARARAKSFVARYPKTPYSARIELAVGPF